MLTLEEQEYFWLSLTPRREKSRSWGSRGDRCVNIARFSLANTGDGSAPPLQIIAVNTHLDVWSEPARQHQAKMVAGEVAVWRDRYPQAVVVGFGDFNSAPGQPPYNILATQLDDAWVRCQASDGCFTNPVASTFHGWLGSRVNTMAGRVIQLFAFWFHGLGATFPAQVPTTVRGFVRAVYSMVTTKPSAGIWEAMPAWPWLQRTVRHNHRADPALDWWVDAMANHGVWVHNSMLTGSLCKTGKM